MGKPISAKLVGLGAFKSALTRYAKTIEKDVDKTLLRRVQMMGTTAKANCRVQSIAQTIRAGKVDNHFEVNTDGVTSVYLEFGTGNYAKTLLGSYPQDWKDMAMKFYINGLGRTPAQPYLYPAFQQHAGEAVIDIIDSIERH